jgi:hypothetical protein
MRTVFSNHEVVHVWASQRQDEGRNSKTSIFFVGDTIYSYGRHFPMGKFIANGEHRAVLLNTDTYGVTTSGHQSLVRGAVSHMLRFYLPAKLWPVGDHWGEEKPAAVRAYHEQERDKHTLFAKRARKGHNIEWRMEYAETEVARFNEMNIFFAWGLEPLAMLDDEGTQALVAKAKALREEQAEEERTRSEQYAQRRAVEVAEAAEKLDLWRKGGSLPNMVYYLPTALRINGNEIETSRGATIPLSYARRLWALIEHVRGGTMPYCPKGFLLGHYELSEISTEGNIIVGCHTIEYAELRRLAVQLEYVTELEAA